MEAKRSRAHQCSLYEIEENARRKHANKDYYDIGGHAQLSTLVAGLRMGARRHDRLRERHLPREHGILQRGLLLHYRNGRDKQRGRHEGQRGRPRRLHT